MEKANSNTAPVRQDFILTDIMGGVYLLAVFWRCLRIDRYRIRQAGTGFAGALGTRKFARIIPGMYIQQDNALMNNALFRMGAKPAKMCSLYGMPIAPVTAESRHDNG